jgi:hypothetical protein
MSDVYNNERVSARNFWRSIDFVHAFFVYYTAYQTAALHKSQEGLQFQGGIPTINSTTELFSWGPPVLSHRCAINISTPMPSAIIATADIANFVVKPAYLYIYVKNVRDLWRVPYREKAYRMSGGMRGLECVMNVLWLWMLKGMLGFVWDNNRLKESRSY